MPPKKSETPGADDLYGEDLPSYEQVVGEEIRAKPVGEPPFTPPSTRAPKTESSEEQATYPSPLLEALQGRDINEIISQLSEQERNLLRLRYDLSTGSRVMSQRRAADIIGIDHKKYRNLEHELMEHINNLAHLAPPEEPK
jgi:hypothetical protein